MIKCVSNWKQNKLFRKKNYIGCLRENKKRVSKK